MNILLIDEHALFREGLSLLLKRLGPDLVIHEARTIEDALTHGPRSDSIHLLLMDFYVSDADGLQGLRRVHHVFPSSPLVLVSASHDLVLIREAMFSGAQGFIHKTATSEEMLHALHDVFGGRGCFVFPGEAQPVSNSLTGRLTPRQREVLAQLCQGKSNKEIGKALSLSENTVRIHLADVFRILGVASRSEAIVLAKSGLMVDRDELYR